MKNSALLLLVCTIAMVQLQAQDSTKETQLIISGYAELYYSYDFQQPGTHAKPSFLYSHNRHNEVNLNLGMIKAVYNTDQLRANLALAAGTYMNANLASEPGVLKNIYEANIGVKISKKHNLWIDAGILPSHIGFESAIGKDCWNVTRSILAENSPYYESGAKLSYTTKNGRWFLSVLILNGWQRIQKPDGNNTPALGTQTTYKPNVKITLNSSSFIGNDKPDSVKQMRYFHNLYGIFQITSNVSLTTGFDIGAEQQAKHSKKYNTWYSPVIIVKLNTSRKTAMAARAELYNDKRGVIIATNTPKGFKTWGISANFDYNILPNAMWRVEARTLNSSDAIFSTKNGGTRNTNSFITTAIAVSF